MVTNQVFNDLIQRMVLDANIADEFWLWGNLRPIHCGLETLHLSNCVPLLVNKRCVILIADLGVLFLYVLQVRFLVIAKQCANNSAASRSVKNMNGTIWILWRNFDRTVTFGCGSPTNHYWNFEIFD